MVPYPTSSIVTTWNTGDGCCGTVAVISHGMPTETRVLDDTALREICKVINDFLDREEQGDNA